MKFIASQSLNGEDGYLTLLSVLVVGAVGVAITISLLTLGTVSSRTSFSHEQSATARAFADACAEEALQQIRSSTPYSGSGSINFLQGSCAYAVSSGTGQNRTVTASSTVGIIVRKVRVTLDKITPKINITSWVEVVDF